MSNTLERVVGKAVLDVNFWTALVTDAEAAVAKAGFSLSNTQMARLQAGLAQTSKGSNAQTLFANIRAYSGEIADYWR
jgi:hypothetical protein